MPGEEQKSPVDKMIMANGRDHWDPSKYERFGLYVFLYNYVRANLDDFSPQPDGHPSKFEDPVGSGNYINFNLTRNSLSTQINDAIYHNYDWFVKHLHLDEPIDLLTEGKDLGINKKTFLSEFYDYAHQSSQVMQMNSELNGPLKGVGDGQDKSLMSSEDMLLLLRHKEDNVRKYFDNVRNAVEGKPGDLDSKGNPVGGYLTVDMTKLEQEKREKMRQIGEGLGSSAFYGVLSAGGIGLSTVSIMGILSYGGLAVGSLFGAAFIANPVGMAALSVLGTVVGVKISKESVNRFIKSLGTDFKNIRDYVHFKVGMGEYAAKDGIPKGYNARKKRYETACEIKAIMVGFKIPKRAADFKDAFEKYFQEQVEKSKHVKHFTQQQLDKLKKYTRYTYQVTNGYNPDTGASIFGRLRGLMSEKFPLERVDYKFENVDEATRHFQARLKVHQTDKPSLRIIKQDIQWLNQLKNFYDNANRQDIYSDLMHQYKNVIIPSVEKIAFDEPLNPDVIRLLSAVLDDDVLGERIKSGISGGEKKVKSVISFLTKETTRENINLAEAFPESATAQLTFDANQIVGACTGDGFGPDKVTGPMLDDVRVIAEFIAKHSVEDESISISGSSYKLEDIVALLDANVRPNTRAYDYLKFMLAKKHDAAKLDEKAVLKYAGIASTNLQPANEAEVIGILGGVGAPPISSVVTNIFGAAGKSDADILAIQSQIDTLSFGADDVKNKNYLYALLATITGKVKDPNVLQEIATDIENLDMSNFDSGIASDIRKKIQESGLPLSVCIALSDGALKKQTDRLQKRQVNEVTEQTLRGIRATGNPNFEQLMSEIETLVYEKINDPATLELYKIKILTQSHPFNEYLQMIFREKVYKLIADKLTADATILQKETGLEKNAEYLQFISTNQYLTDIQKEQLYAQVADFIESAASANVQNLELQILNNKQANKEVSGDISRYLNNSYSSKGLKEFLESRTDRSVRVRKKLSTYNDIAETFTNAVVPLSQYGGTNRSVVDASSADAKFIVTAFFKYPKTQRQTSDPLLLALQKTSSIYSSDLTTLDNTGKRGGIYADADIEEDLKNISFFSDILRQKDEIIGPSSTLTSNVDKLAALRNIKRHALEAFKYQIVQFVTPTQIIGGESAVQAAIDGNEDQFNNIIEVWRAFMKVVDDECLRLAALPEIAGAGPELEGKGYISGVQTIDFFKQPKNIANVRSNDTIQPGR